MNTMVPNILDRIKSEYDNTDILVMKQELDNLILEYKLNRFYIVYDLYHMHLVSARYYKQGIICKLFNVADKHISQFSNLIIERIIEICLSVPLIIKYSKDEGMITFAYEIVDYVNEVLNADLEFNDVDESINILTDYFISVKNMLFIIISGTIESYSNYNDLDNIDNNDLLSIINNGIFIIKNIEVNLEGTLSRLILEMYNRTNYVTTEF